MISWIKAAYISLKFCNREAARVPNTLACSGLNASAGLAGISTWASKLILARRFS
jgi:hypothetical protein